MVKPSVPHDGATHVFAMFSALRVVAIVGVIFYLSPVRNPDDGPASREVAHRSTRAPSPSAEPASHLDSLWKLLPDSAKAAVLERMLTSALGPAPSTSKPQAVAPATDTLQPEDLQPAWRGEAKKARP
jgi:hypothetical protein